MTPADPDRGRDFQSWRSAGLSATVAGQVIPGGLLYIGKDLPGVSSRSAIEPALIDPSLPVACSAPNLSGTGVPYWPSYTDLSPASRAAYLRWLVQGRSDPATYIGYVFLFFYGLERRILHETEQARNTPGEIAAISAEVQRLLALHSSKSSFVGYAASFLEFIRAVHLGAPPSAQAFDFRWNPVECNWPDGLLLALGRLGVAGQPIPAELALAWLAGDPDHTFRTPARRCPAEFQQLFRLRYPSRCDGGRFGAPPPDRLALTYQPASASFDRPISVPFPEIPDMRRHSAALARLREFADECEQELEPFSRLLGRDPGARDGLVGLSLLPGELLTGREPQAIEGLRSWIDSMLGAQDWVSVEPGALLAHWPPARDGKLTRNEFCQFEQLLEKLGIGVEPDVRFDGPALTKVERAILYRCSPDAPASPSPWYRAAATMLALGVAVAAADGQVDPAEERLLEELLERGLELDEGERERLAAHLRWLLLSPPKATRLARRLELLDAGERELLAGLLLEISAVQGGTGPAELKLLGKLYRSLGVDPDSIHSRLHARLTADAGPVVVRPAGAGPPAYAIPAPPPPGASRVVALDRDRIERRLKETAEVVRLLGDVFVEEPEPAAETPSAVTPVAGMDGPHVALAQQLATRERWSRGELEALCRSLKLLPDGAIERINEALLDLRGEPAIDGEEELAVNVVLLKEVLS